MKILVVDDEKLLVKGIKFRLRRYVLLVNKYLGAYQLCVLHIFRAHAPFACNHNYPSFLPAG